MGNNQTAYNLINQINNISDPNLNFVIFYEELSQYMIKPNCATMNLAELWNFTGTCIFTESTQWEFLNNIPHKINKIFYTQNLDWLNQTNYEYLWNIYNGQVFCRSESHADAIERYCGKRPSVVNEITKMI